MSNALVITAVIPHRRRAHRSLAATRAGAAAHFTWKVQSLFPVSDYPHRPLAIAKSSTRCPAVA